MAVGECSFPKIHPVKGVKLGTSCAGIKQTDRDDLTIIEIDTGSVSTAVFTQNSFAAAPIKIARKNLSKANPRWLLINSGNANAGNGNQGIDDALSCCQSLADLVSGQLEQVLPFSTGVIGEALPMVKMVDALPSALHSLSEAGWKNAAEAIMTTDTHPKGASLRLDLDGFPVVITGICKGAGMIHPNMATMLSFIATDASIDRKILDKCLRLAVDQSFNCISVDGDTSTNDACMLIATGFSDAPEIAHKNTLHEKFMDGLQWICNQLAEAIVRDGEGATKLMKVVVTQAANDREARNVASAVVQSPLVKTALFAADPNWGRILAAIGRAGVDGLDVSKVSIWLDDVCIVDNGQRAADYSEQDGQAVMAKDEVMVRIALGRGTSEQRMLGCDLSYDYVRINAEYRT